MPEHSNPFASSGKSRSPFSSKSSPPMEGLKASKPKDSTPRSDSGKLPQNYNVKIAGKDTVLYMGPEDGPFECQHCEYFQAPSSCELVGGTISPQGCCSLFGPNKADGMPAVEGTAYETGRSTFQGDL